MPFLTKIETKIDKCNLNDNCLQHDKRWHYFLRITTGEGLSEMAHQHPAGQNHGHRHGYGHHSHGHGNNARRVFVALCLTGGFMFAEIVGGVISGSLALLADAAHMLIDTVSLLLAWLAFGLSKKPADRARSYGYHRFPILAAFTNGISLLFIVGWIFVEAAQRLFHPGTVLAGPMLVVAVLGLVINIAAFIALHGADRNNLNIRGALMHVLGDLLGSLAAIIAAIVIMTSGWTAIDPLLSILVGLLVLRSAWLLVRDAGHVLLEGTPAQLDVQEIGPDLIASIDSVEDVHHVHAWSLSQERSLLTLHARIRAGSNADAAINAIQRRLAERFDVDHVTVQIEIDSCADEAVAAC
jgi:cobalt-zinc-cadmium efflux system protein